MQTRDTSNRTDSAVLACWPISNQKALNSHASNPSIRSLPPTGQYICSKNNLKTKNHPQKSSFL